MKEIRPWFNKDMMDLRDTLESGMQIDLQDIRDLGWAAYVSVLRENGVPLGTILYLPNVEPEKLGLRTFKSAKDEED